jgi:hypothetical protein
MILDFLRLTLDITLSLNKKVFFFLNLARLRVHYVPGTVLKHFKYNESFYLLNNSHEIGTIITRVLQTMQMRHIWLEKPKLTQLCQSTKLTMRSDITLFSTEYLHLIYPLFFTIINGVFL